jgi:hypothetical protein
MEPQTNWGQSRLELTSNPGGMIDAPPHNRDAGFSLLNRPIDFTACASGGEHWVGRRHGFGGAQRSRPTPGMQAPVRQEWLLKRHEDIIEPELPIIDRFPDDAFYRQGLRSKVQRVGTNASPMEESNQHGNRRSSLWTRSL